MLAEKDFYDILWTVSNFKRFCDQTLHVEPVVLVDEDAKREQVVEVVVAARRSLDDGVLSNLNYFTLNASAVFEACVVGYLLAELPVCLQIVSLDVCLHLLVALVASSLFELKGSLLSLTQIVLKGTHFWSLVLV